MNKYTLKMDEAGFISLFHQDGSLVFSKIKGELEIDLSSKDLIEIALAGNVQAYKPPGKAKLQMSLKHPVHVKSLNFEW